MDVAAPSPVAEEPRRRGPAVLLRLPVRYAHDPATDRWSFSFEMPRITGGGHRSREAAERAAIAALQRHLARALRIGTGADEVGHLSVTLVPGAGPEPPAVASAPPGTVAAHGVLVPATGMGFHPHSERTPASGEVRRSEGVTLMGRPAAAAAAPADATAIVVITDPATGEGIDECWGPREDGGCPAVNAGGVVPCAGCRIRGELLGVTRRFRFDVAPGSTECPLAWLVESLAAASR